MDSVQSSNVAAIGVDVLVRFNSGQTYRYRDVGLDVARALYSAESKGKAVHALLKGKFDYELVLDSPRHEQVPL